MEVWAITMGMRLRKIRRFETRRNEKTTVAPFRRRSPVLMGCIKKVAIGGTVHLNER